ncbi:MAG: hypothetical protein WCO51_07300 [bacterium]
MEQMLLIGLITGSIGTGYFIYGKKQSQLMPMLAGGGLCIVPCMIGNPVLLILASIVLCALPFIIRSE